MNLTEYYDYFGVDEKIIQNVMSQALSRGGDYCDLFFQHSIANHISLEDKAVNRTHCSSDLGVGIRVLKGEQTGYSFTDGITPEGMTLAAQAAANIADSDGKTSPIQVRHHKIPNYYPVETRWKDVPIDRKIPFLQEINDNVFAQDQRVIKCNISFGDGATHVLVATSDGRIVHDYRPMIQISVVCTAEQKGQREQNYLNLSARSGIEFLTPETVERLAKEPVRRTVQLFDSVKPDPGEMEVVLASGRSGILLHEAIGHGMEADFNRKNISIFCDKMNQQVAEKFVTIVDDGTNPNVRGSINVDDEGNDTERTFLVKDGILRNYLHDRISARHYQVSPTGNGRRQSFRFPPMPRMRNTYMLPGPHKKEEIIRSVKKGLYAESFTNGEVLIGAGDFTFYVKSGYLIEDGRLTRPIKDVNIIGNGPDVLRDIAMVGDDFRMAESGGTCGKDGQWVPVSLGQPTVKVSKVTVGGIKS